MRPLLELLKPSILSPSFCTHSSLVSRLCHLRSPHFHSLKQILPLPHRRLTSSCLGTFKPERLTLL